MKGCESVTDALKPKYQPFGVLVGKEWATGHGCRPVLYLSDAECEELCIKQRHMWRVVRFEPSGKDGWISWIHEREWRCKGDFELPENPVVVVRGTKDVARLQKLIEKDPKSFASKPRAIIPLRIVC